MLAQGVPMLLMGDERSRSQGGNNNAYCQDNAVSWMDWTSDPDPTLATFVANLLALRREEPSLRRRRFFDGAAIDPEEPLRDVHWLSPDGTEMEGTAWADEGRQAFGMQIGNDGEAGQRLLILFNAAETACTFRLAPSVGGPWRVVFDTTRETGAVLFGPAALAEGGSLNLPARAVLVLAARTDEAA